MKTFMEKKENVDRKWYVIDAEGVTLGRLATKVATVLKGKHKPIYTPHVDCGDFVIVVNAEKVKLTGNKLNDKMYYNHSGYVGGLRERNAKTMIEVGRGKEDISKVEKMLNLEENTSLFTAPSNGLYLESVIYDEN